MIGGADNGGSGRERRKLDWRPKQTKHASSIRIDKKNNITVDDVTTIFLAHNRYSLVLSEHATLLDAYMCMK